MKVIFALVFAVTFSCIMAKGTNSDEEDKTVELPDYSYPADSPYEYCNAWVITWTQICKERSTTEKDKYVLQIDINDTVDYDLPNMVTARRCRDDICSDVIKKDRQEELWKLIRCEPEIHPECNEDEEQWCPLGLYDNGCDKGYFCFPSDSDCPPQGTNSDEEDGPVELPDYSNPADSPYEYCNAWVIQWTQICKERTTTEKDKYVLQIAIEHPVNDIYFVTARRCRDDICSDVIKKDRQEELSTVEINS